MTLEATLLTRFVYLLIVAIFFSLLSCNGQQTDSNTSLKMGTEKFNIDAYDSCVNANNNKGELNAFICKQTLSDGSVLEQSSSVSSAGKTYMSVKIPPPPALFKEVKEYYSSGTLKLEYETYVGVLETPSPNDASGYGIEKRYEKNGVLKETVDHNKQYDNYKINLKGLLQVLTKEKLLDTLTADDKLLFQQLWFPDKKTQEITAQDFFRVISKSKITKSTMPKVLDPFDEVDRKSLSVGFEDGKWNVTKDLYPFGFIHIIVDAATGNIVRKVYEQEKRS